MTRTRATTLAALLACLTVPAFAQQDEGFESWDTDSDGSIGQVEFNNQFSETELFEDWDTDGDGFLSERELGYALFEGYDKDDSGRIEAPEYDYMLEDFGQDGLLEL